MKKYFLIILSVIFCVNCGNRPSKNNTTEQADTQDTNSELVIADNCVIFLLPDSLEQYEMLKRHGDDTYNEIIADMLYYNYEAQQVLQELEIKIIYCDKKYIKLVNSKGNIQKLKRSDIGGNMIVFHKDKSPIILNAVDFDRNKIAKYLGKTEIPLIQIADEFAKYLKEGKPLSVFFSDSWTLVYHTDNRVEGSTDGRVMNLRNTQIDSVIIIKLKNDGDGWLLDVIGEEKREPKTFEFKFELNKQIEHWDRFEAVRYSNMPSHNIYILGAGESDLLKLHYNKDKLITVLEYRSEDPG
ncbi:hypothetical protein HW49_01345 [Porphyromonadaceae bacterium COT-184 OH4590]|nr:hypothetical protein HW49_01345 [Porphyromonadaceae bacterium COT-184 OH4590]